jgi:beta-glucosidase
MGRRVSLHVIVVAALAACLIATLQAQAAKQGTRGQDVERRIDSLLSRMTLEEKLNQLTLLSDGQMKDTPAEARKPVGAVFSETDPVLINKYQHDAVEHSRLHIPILFAFDTIHGFRTIFPIPLGTASSFDPNVARTDHRIGAFESAAVGLKQIYSPMVDVSHEPRWGRISEAAGEDPYLNSVMAAARVKGAQGDDYGAPDKVVTSVKHYAAYGQPEAGRDYNTTDMSLQRLWNFYLPPFKAAVDAGSDTLMCSFNAINGVPGCANKYTENRILKQRWGFDGFIESDYTAVAELRSCPGENPAGGPCGHGFAEDGKDAARLALNAGTDSEMVSTNFRDFGKSLVAGGQVSMKRIDDAVRRILRVKFRAGLFEHPYVNVGAAEGKQLLPQNRAAARKAAGRAVVLLKNDGPVLPLDPTKSTAIIGPLGDSAHDMLGPWWGKGDDAEAVSLLAGMKGQNANTTFTPGCTLSHNELYDPDNECASEAGFSAAVAAAQAADQVVLALGETREMSGEAEARSMLDLPGKQEELIEAIEATGKPFAVVLFNGRPLTLDEVQDHSPAILEAWFGGVEGGNAVADVLYGKVNPGGKLPVSFPRNEGQVPIYYNHQPTGRPCDPNSKYNSRHRDILTCTPQYEFGFGLSYTTFTVSNLRLSSTTMDARRGRVTARADVTNTGTRAGDEVAQLYINDPVASISQPVPRLRGFERETL